MGPATLFPASRIAARSTALHGVPGRLAGLGLAALGVVVLGILSLGLGARGARRGERRPCRCRARMVRAHSSSSRTSACRGRSSACSSAPPRPGRRAHAGVTRNPLADPGLLGVNAGAAAAVIVAIAVLGLTGLTAYVWFAFLGAAIASVVVYALGTVGARPRPPPGSRSRARRSRRPSPRSPTRSRSATRTLHRFNHWNVGSLAGRDTTVDARRAVPARRHRARAAPPPSAQRARPRRRHRRALGANIGRTRIAGGRRDHAPVRGRHRRRRADRVRRASRSRSSPARSWAPTSAGSSPTPRCSARCCCSAPTSSAASSRAPAELEVGIVTAILGAPVFIALVRRRRIAALTALARRRSDPDARPASRCAPHATLGRLAGAVVAVSAGGRGRRAPATTRSRAEVIAALAGGGSRATSSSRDAAPAARALRASWSASRSASRARSSRA